MSGESVLSRPNVNVEVHLPFLVLEAGDVCLGHDPDATSQGHPLTLSLHRSKNGDAAVHPSVGVVDFVAVAGDDHGVTSLGLELRCSNRKLVVRDYVSHASATTLAAPIVNAQPSTPNNQTSREPALARLARTGIATECSHRSPVSAREVEHRQPLARFGFPLTRIRR